MSNEQWRRETARISLRGSVKVAVRAIRVTEALSKTPAGRVIAGQLLRSATSAGANYEEARGSESRRDFAHKIGISLKEMKETRYWLRVTSEAGLLVDGRLAGLSGEVEELCRILGRSLTTARRAALS